MTCYLKTYVQSHQQDKERDIRHKACPGLCFPENLMATQMRSKSHFQSN